MKTLALKYRPRNFDELIGQNVIANSLRHALDTGRLGHAYLFSGLRGSGKTSSARIFAKALLCEKGISSHPCETCANCKMANEGRHLDIIEMDAASNRKIDDIRELIEQTKYAPSSARFKIFIIDEVHMLTKEAFNALLKTLEEPPSYIKFILATTDPLKLPTTILSRTQHYRFKPISKPNVVKHLAYILNRENIPYELPALEILARSGSGSLRDTMTLLEQAIIFSREEVSASAVSSMLGLLDPKEIEEIFKVVSSGNRALLPNLIKNLGNADCQILIDEMIDYLKAKFLAQDSSFSLLIYERFFRILSQAKNSLSQGSDPEFALYIMLYMMMEAFNFTDINDAIKTVKLAAINEPEQIISQNPKKSKSPYEEFIDKIYDRSYELGQCFDESIKFVKFENNELVLESSAKGKNQELLRTSSKAIMEVLRNNYDSKTKIKIQKVKEVKKSSSDQIAEMLNSSNLQLNTKKDEPKKEDPITKNEDKMPNKTELNSNLIELSRHFGEPKIIED